MDSVFRENDWKAKKGLATLALLAWLSGPIFGVGCGPATDLALSEGGLSEGGSTTGSVDGSGDGDDEASAGDDEGYSDGGDGSDTSSDDDYELQLSVPELKGGYVRSDRYESSDKSATLKCDDDAYVSKISLEYTDFGTSKAITYIEVECTDLEDDVETRTAGVRMNDYGFLNELSCSNPGWTGTGFGTYIPGIKILNDNYVKNLQVKCASIEVSSSQSYAFNDTYTVEMTSSDPYYWSWIYPDVSGDSEDERDCGENEVLSGLKIRYAHDPGGFLDNEEAAITQVEYYCSEISAVSTSEGFPGFPLTPVTPSLGDSL